MSVLINDNGTLVQQDASAVSQLAAVDTENILGGGAGATTDGQALIDQLAADDVQAQTDIGQIRTDLSDLTDDMREYHVVPSKNLLSTPYKDGNVLTSYGVTYTVNANGTVSTTGTADVGHVSGFALLQDIGSNLQWLNGKVISGCPDGSDATYFIAVLLLQSPWTVYTKQTTTGAVISGIPNDNSPIQILIRVQNGVDVSGKTFYPMLCAAADYAADPSYEPYYVCMRDGMFPRSEQAVLGAKNILDIEDKTSKVINGITFTINADGTITANGTSTAQALLYLRQENYQVNEPLILSGNPSGAGDSTYSIYARDTNGGYYYPYAPFATGDNEVFVPSGVTLDYIAIYIRGSKTVDNIVFKPMLRLASDSDNAYAPYAMTNRDLTNIIDRLMRMSGSGGGFAPIGTVISYLGTTAPEDYLICDGTTYNIADYKQLADFIKDQFGSYNYFGGNGTTTFAVPDLRGEFLRGSGANSHANQGSGANVGVHQDGTIINSGGGDGTGALFGYNLKMTSSNSNPDKVISTGPCAWVNSQFSTDNNVFRYTSRPTNTSVLYCIKAVCAGDVYSTSERVVGTWIDGKPIYQKTAHTGAISATGTYTIPFKNVETVIDEHLMMKKASGGFYFPVVVHASNSNYTAAPFSIDGTGTANDATMFITIGSAIDGSYGVSDSWLTLRYTKTTD